MERAVPPTPEMWKIFRQLFKRSFCTESKYTWAILPVPLDVKLGRWHKVERHIIYDAYRKSKTLFRCSKKIGTSSHVCSFD